MILYFTEFNLIEGVDVGIYITQLILSKLHTYDTPYA